jgi:hypothetical protein
LTGIFAIFSLAVAWRFAVPGWFRPLMPEPPRGRFCQVAGTGIGLVSGFAGVGGGILTNVVMTLVGMSMHKSIGRAAAAGLVVSIRATLVAVIGSMSLEGGSLGSINLPMWASIAPAQAAAAWIWCTFRATDPGRTSQSRLCRGTGCNRPGHDAFELWLAVNSALPRLLYRRDKRNRSESADLDQGLLSAQVQRCRRSNDGLLTET